MPGNTLYCEHHSAIPVSAVYCLVCTAAVVQHMVSAHLAVSVLEAQLVQGCRGQGHVLEGLGPEAALEGNVVDAEGHLGVLELAAGLVHILLGATAATAGVTAAAG